MGDDKNGLNRFGETNKLRGANSKRKPRTLKPEQDIENKTTTENQLTKLFAIDWTILTSYSLTNSSAKKLCESVCC